MPPLDLWQRAQLYYIREKLRALCNRYARIQKHNARIHWRMYRAYAANTARSARLALEKVEYLLREN